MGVERGFTLVEIMLALVITLVVAGALHDTLRFTQRMSRVQANQVVLHSNLRAGAIAVASELLELGATDILNASNATLTYRAMRGVGFLCQPSTPTTLRIARLGFTGHRDPQPARDSLYVLLASDSGETWLPLALTGVSTAGECRPGEPAITLVIPSTDSVANLEPGTPIRIGEVMELRLYRSEGKSWLGARSISAGEVIQPLVGPLTDGRGFSLELLNAWGQPTVDPVAARGIRAALRGISESPAAVEQVLTSRVTLRSSPGP